MSIALWCLFFAAFLHVGSKLPLAIAQTRDGGLDNRNPRDQQARLTGWGRRAKAAHENQIESFPLFAAGVLVATLVAKGGASIDLLAGAYVAARLVYIGLYIGDVAPARTLVWSVRYFVSLALLTSPAWAS
ncbi:MAG: MAPEG family protein [Nannocystis sp.]|nr:MAPEG family protein [Nannocystis sp.]